jgi:putative sigma-54 modulation protein
MQINIAGHQMDVTPALQDYVREKLQRIERHFDNLIDVHVVLEVEKQRQKAEATIHASGATIHAEAVEQDMYAAIDALIDKLDRQVLRHKERTRDHHRNAGAG